MEKKIKMDVLEQPYRVRNFVKGEFVDHHSDNLDLVSPLNGAVIGQVPMSDSQSLDGAVRAASEALAGWSSKTIKERAKVFFRYRTLLESHIDELSNLIHLEHGKTLIESRAEILKAIELCEFAVSLPQIIGNEIQEVSKGIECRVDRKPVGVVAAITPFNFPSMVPHWSFPNALVLGNTMVLKPSEKVPLSMIRTAELLKEAGLPDGVFNIIHGGQEIVKALCDHPDIKAITFVGSTKVAKIVYRRATATLKRCVALGGAKNHLVVLPDAAVTSTASNIISSMSGCAGQRCMAASVMIAVGDVDPIIQKMLEVANTMVCGGNLGPVISQDAKQRIENCIALAEKQGAQVILDGRDPVVEGKRNGFYIGTTIIDNVTPDMAIAKEEIFGPVICIIRVKDLEEAIHIENSSVYGNAATVGTQNGADAAIFMDRASAGMIGVNVGVPVPREPFSFGGWNESKFGVGDITGKSSVEFWTQLKKITYQW